MWAICDSPYPGLGSGTPLRLFLSDFSPDEERPTCFIQTIENNVLRTILYFIDGLSVVITKTSVHKQISVN
jgi:hypothetical protein